MEALRSARLRAQLLTDREATTPEAVCERVLAVQGQDPRGLRLAVRSRSTGLSSGDVDRALSEDRTLVVDWLCRGTLHLVGAEEHAWLHALTAPKAIAWSDRRVGQVGLTPAQAERGRAVVLASLAADGPQTRDELRDRLDVAGIPTAGQAVTHLLYSGSLRDEVVRGPVRGREQAFVGREDWLGPAHAVDRDRALAELARRYLAGHGPATADDLAKWSGLGIRDCRRGLAAIAGSLAGRDDDRLALAATPDADDRLPEPRLLGPFEPILHGWPDREWVVGDHRELITVNGIFKAFALVDGRAVATWRLPSRGGELALDALCDLPAKTRAALVADAEAVQRFLAPTAG